MNESQVGSLSHLSTFIEEREAPKDCRPRLPEPSPPPWDRSEKPLADFYRCLKRGGQ